jgi:hypothetical protein
VDAAAEHVETGAIVAELAELAASDGNIHRQDGRRGFLPVAPEITKGNPISSRVKWVYTYATNVEGYLVSKARLVWAHNAGTQPGGSEFEQNTMSNVAKSLHWKALIHTALVDGAHIKRLDISNAHQSSRRGPTDPPAYSYPIPGCPMHTPDGVEANMQWLNMLNGMPPAGAAFEGDLSALTKEFGMRSMIQDDHGYVYDKYLKLCFNVDDILVAYKGSALGEFVAHLSKRCGR